MKLQPFARWAALMAMPALLVAAPAMPSFAATAEEMRDLAPDHWAYKAIEGLIERYGVMAGFPDQTFRGTKTVTRFELAAALSKVMTRMDALAAGQKPTAPVKAPVTAADKAMVDKLKAEFASELAALEGRVKKQEDALGEIQTKLGKFVKVGGSFTTTIADDTLDQGKDRSNPFISTSLSLSVKGTASETTTFDVAMGANSKASGSGDVPGPMGGGAGWTSDAVNFRTARFTTKIGATTVNVGRFPFWLVGFGPYSDQSFPGSFALGLGSQGADASQLRTGGDIGGSFATSLGPVNIQAGLNSNIIISQVGMSLGPVTFKGGYETDHKAITQNLLGTGARVKTTDNAAVVLDIGGEAPIGGTLQANLNNFNLTQYGGGLRGSLFGTDIGLVVMLFSPPDKSVTVATGSLAVAIPPHELFGGRFKTPTINISALDNYTLDAPAQSGRQTTGAGGQALGKNAGLSVNLGIENPWIPNLQVEYNVQAALIEGIFAPTANAPITGEVFIAKSSLGF